MLTRREFISNFFDEVQRNLIPGKIFALTVSYYDQVSEFYPNNLPRVLEIALALANHFEGTINNKVSNNLRPSIKDFISKITDYLPSTCYSLAKSKEKVFLLLCNLGLIVCSNPQLIVDNVIFLLYGTITDNCDCYVLDNIHAEYNKRYPFSHSRFYDNYNSRSINQINLRSITNDKIRTRINVQTTRIRNFTNKNRTYDVLYKERKLILKTAKFNNALSELAVLLTFKHPILPLLEAYRVKKDEIQSLNEYYNILLSDLIYFSPQERQERLDEWFDIVFNRQLTISDISLENREDIAKQLVEGVKYLHSCNILHLGLTPDNIGIICRENAIQVKIIDFSCSIFKLKQKLEGVKTPLISRPPELLEGCINGKLLFKVSKMTDYWILGCCLTELDIGVPPFSYSMDCVISTQSARKRVYSSIHSILNKKATITNLIAGTYNPGCGLPYQSKYIEKLANNLLNLIPSNRKLN